MILRGSAEIKRKSFNIYVREKHSKQNMYHAVLNIVCFKTFSEKRKKN